MCVVRVWVRAGGPGESMCVSMCMFAWAEWVATDFLFGTTFHV